MDIKKLMESAEGFFRRFFQDARNTYKGLKERYGQTNILIVSGAVLLFMLLLLPSTRYFLKYWVYDSFHASSRYFFNTGIRYEEKKLINYAIGSFKRALRYKDNRFNIDMNDLYQFESLFNLAVMYYSHKQEYPQALFYFNQYIELCDQKGIKNPHEKDIYAVVNFILGMDDSTKNSEAKVLKNKGNEAYFRKDYTMALELYRRALTVDPSYIEVYNNIATVYFEQNDFKNAVDYWKLTLLFDPDEIDIYVNIALAYETKLESLKEAVKWYGKLLTKLNPKDPRHETVRLKIMELDQRIKARL